MNYWYIWYEVFEGDRYLGRGRYPTGYKHKSSAERRAKQMWSGDQYDPMLGVLFKHRWIVSQTNPWDHIEGE